MATITDVAERAEVSVATVSRALRGLPNVAEATRQRVVRAAEELKYVADPSASRLAAGRTSTVGLVMPKLGTWYYAQFFAGVESILAEAGMDVLPFPLTRPGARERFLTWMPFRKRVDGLIIVDVPMSDEHLDRLLAVEVPTVTVGVSSTRFSSLGLDNQAGARLATEHLIGLGHRRIGLIGGGGAEAYHFQIPEDRRAGYRQAMASRGLEVDEDLLVDGRLDMAGGVDAIQRLLHRPDPPKAVVALSDEMAIGAIQIATSLGITVPYDLSIVGFDDHEVAEFIGLTTVRQDVHAHGEAAASWVLEEIEEPRAPRHQTQTPRLIMRSTTTRAERTTDSAASTPV